MQVKLKKTRLDVGGPQSRFAGLSGTSYSGVNKSPGLVRATPLPALAIPPPLREILVTTVTTRQKAYMSVWLVCFSFI